MVGKVLFFGDSRRLYADEPVMVLLFSL